MDEKLVTGTLDMIILQVIVAGASYGYAIAQEVLARTGGQIELKEGSLYPALHRLEGKGWLTASWAEVESGRRRKYYKVTAAGQKALAAKRNDWREFRDVVDGVMGDLRHGMA